MAERILPTTLAGVFFSFCVATGFAASKDRSECRGKVVWEGKNRSVAVCQSLDGWFLAQKAGFQINKLPSSICDPGQTSVGTDEANIEWEEIWDHLIIKRSMDLASGKIKDRASIPSHGGKFKGKIC